MRILRLLIGVPLVVLGLLLLLASLEGFVIGKDAMAGAIGMGVIGLALVVVGWRFVRGPKQPVDWRSDPATDKQKSYARGLGIRIPRGTTKGELSDLISQAVGDDFDDDEDDED